MNIVVGELRAEESLADVADGYILKIFLACSKVSTKVFRLSGVYTSIGQTLRVSNIAGKELEFWLCTTRNKIIVLFNLYSGHCHFVLA